MTIHGSENPDRATAGRHLKVQKLLFICSRNKIRSLSAERLLDGIPGYEVRSAGTQRTARIVVTEGHLGWADTIVCMEKSHLRQLRERYPEALRGKVIITLHIADEYQFMDEALLDELQAKLEPHLTFSR